MYSREKSLHSTPHSTKWLNLIQYSTPFAYCSAFVKVKHCSTITEIVQYTVHYQCCLQRKEGWKEGRLREGWKEEKSEEGREGGRERGRK